MASTKYGTEVVTYAQNLCCGAARTPMWASARYQSSSAAKSLIYIGSLKCFFLRHFSETLVNQGFRTIGHKLSTKLSTENLENCKATSNQALSTFFASEFAGLATNAYFLPAL
jgi:hypothetical protein